MMPPDEWLLRKLARKPGYYESRHDDWAPPQDPLGWLRAEVPDFEARVRGKRVADFGCGTGSQARALASTYDCRVVGIDTNLRCIVAAERLAREQQMDRGQVTFRDSAAPDLFGTFDVVISQDTMEHFAQPEAALETMRRLLRPGGQIMLAFGPPWFAPWGSHAGLFFGIPWVNLLFREKTVMRVRGSYRPYARSYEDCGLNRMSLQKFEALLSASPLVIDYIKFHGAKGQNWVNGIPLVRELLVMEVTCLLTRRS